MSEIARFHVMGLLQAARALELGFNIDEAKSWGLNRALFYAAARRAWAAAKSARALAQDASIRLRPRIFEIERSQSLGQATYRFGGEKVYLADDLRFGLRFAFGEQVQTPEEFDLRIKSAFNDWSSAWSEARGIVRSADPADIESSSRFYRNVYEPRRDFLVARWGAFPRPARRVGPRRTATLRKAG